MVKTNGGSKMNATPCCGCKKKTGNKEPTGMICFKSVLRNLRQSIGIGACEKLEKCGKDNHTTENCSTTADYADAVKFLRKSLHCKKLRAMLIIKTMEDLTYLSLCRLKGRRRIVFLQA